MNDPVRPLRYETRYYREDIPSPPRSPGGYEAWDQIVEWSGPYKGVHHIGRRDLETYGYRLTSKHISIEGRLLRKIGENPSFMSGYYVPDLFFTGLIYQLFWWLGSTWKLVKERTVTTLRVWNIRKS
jgi:hypothetical protein